jgi:hypothetical protein
MLQHFSRGIRCCWRLAGTVVRITTGASLISAGVALLGWVGYNLFVELLPEAEGRDPWGAIKFSVVLVVAGFVLLRD